MKRLISFLFLLAGLFLAPSAYAQFIPGGLFEKNQGNVLVKVLEQGSEAPVPYASAYLTAKNDTPDRRDTMVTSDNFCVFIVSTCNESLPCPNADRVSIIAMLVNKNLIESFL